MCEGDGSLETALLILAAVAYGGQAAVSAAWILRSPPVPFWRRWGFLAAALAFHTAYLALRGGEIGGLPIETRMDSVVLFLWVTAVILAVTTRPYKLDGMSPLMWPMFAACAVVLYAVAAATPVERPALDRTWLLLHLIPLYLGYGAFAVGALSGLCYLVQRRLLRARSGGALRLRLPSLETLEKAGRSAVSLGFPLATIGLAVGVLWAVGRGALLGREWYGNPKVLAGTAMWLIYGAVLHIRLFGRLTERRAALLTILGFLTVLATFAVEHVYAATARAGGI